MRVGDLVELSAYGKKLTCNYHRLASVGLVVAIDATESQPSGVHPMTAISVRWVGEERGTYQTRRELRHAK